MTAARRKPSAPMTLEQRRDLIETRTLHDAVHRDRTPARWGELPVGLDQIDALTRQGSVVTLTRESRIESATWGEGKAPIELLQLLRANGCSFSLTAQKALAGVRWPNRAPTTALLDGLRAFGVTVTLNTETRIKRAVRLDVWDQMVARGNMKPEHAAAVRRLEDDMATRIGVNTQESGAAEYVDGGTGDAELVNARMLEAADRVEEVLAMVGPPSCRLLRQLIEPGLQTGEAIEWRDVVRKVTGETRQECHAALIRVAAESLFDCYEAIDARKRKRR